MTLHTKITGENPDELYLSVNPLLGLYGENVSVPKHRLPDAPMEPDTAYEITSRPESSTLVTTSSARPGY